MKNNKLQKNIPDGWHQEKFGAIGKVLMCKRIFKHETLLSGPIPFYKISTFGKVADAFILEDLFEKYKDKYPYPKKGEILISASGTIGRTVVFNGEKAYFQDSNIVWLSHSQDKILNKFLGYVYLITRWASTDGGIISRLYNDDLRSIQFKFPPLSEQNRIVAVLETWDKAIEKLKKKIKIKKNIKRGLMQDLLTGKRRVGGFKDKWQPQSIGDVFNLKKGSELSKEKLNDSGKFECILYGELYTTYSEVIYHIKSKTNISEGTPSKAGDILIPASTTTVAIDLAIAASLGRDNVLLGGDINILRPKNKIDSRFFAYYLTHAKKHNLARLAQGVTIVHLYASDFKNIVIEVPSIEEQTAIADIITTAEKEIVEMEKRIALFDSQKKYLLNNLITGTIRTSENLK